MSIYKYKLLQIKYWVWFKWSWCWLEMSWFNQIEIMVICVFSQKKNQTFQWCNSHCRENCGWILQLCEINLWNGSFSRGRLWPFTVSCCLKSDSSNNQLPLDKISGLQVISFFHIQELRAANWFQADYTDCLLGGSLSVTSSSDWPRSLSDSLTVVCKKQKQINSALNIFANGKLIQLITNWLYSCCIPT